MKDKKPNAIIKKTSQKRLEIYKTRYNISVLINGAERYLQGFLEQKKEKKEVPTIAGLIVFIGCGTDVFHRKLLMSEKLQRLVDDMMAFREDRLINNGLNREVDSKFSQFLLKAKHGYEDQKNTLIQNNLNLTNDVLNDVMKYKKTYKKQLATRKM